MPTILVNADDFRRLLGERVEPRRLEQLLALVKGEFKGSDDDGNWRVELNDTNRPDLWSAEGIARQIGCTLGRRRAYPFFHEEPVGQILVEAGLEKIRPYVAAFVVDGLDITESTLVQIIQTQEKLAENFGRHRLAVAIGVYNRRKITFPVHYRPQPPQEHSYVPLGEDNPLTLAQILERHPKGIQYRNTIAGHEHVPLLIDDAGMTLSMPPIVNSRETGEVVPGDADLFVEATGTDLQAVILALNIMACDLSDRGGKVQRVRTVYPQDTPLGRQLDVPLRLDNKVEVPLEDFSRLLGEPVTAPEVADVLGRYGCDVTLAGERLRVQPPPTRADYLHPVDAVEDFAIARGYDSFNPRMPQEFSVGRFHPLAELEDRVRDLLIGLGYEEVISNLLVSRLQVAERMNQPDKKLVEILNRMNENYAVLRDLVLPSLLQLEARSSTAAYPHRVFEVGEVAVFAAERPYGSRTELHAAALVVHRQAGLSESHADLLHLAEQLGVELRLKPGEHPCFIPGRCARVLLAPERQVGFLGELHPLVLRQWEIGMPAAAFEISLSDMPAGGASGHL